MAGPHDGHRERMRERILKNGIDSLQDHEVLEYMLFDFIPYKDTNEMGHDLINLGGSFKGVFDLSYDKLLQVKGMTKRAALFFSVFADLARKYISGDTRRKIMLKGRGAVRDYLRPRFKGLEVEVAFCLAMDPHDQVIACEPLKKSGRGDGVDVSLGDLKEFAERTKASQIVLAHNHPSGLLTPSASDINFTISALFTLESLGYEFSDHIIFGKGDDYYSFNDAGKLKEMRTARENLVSEIIHPTSSKDSETKPSDSDESADDITVPLGAYDKKKRKFAETQTESAAKRSRYDTIMTLSEYKMKMQELADSMLEPADSDKPIK